MPDMERSWIRKYGQVALTGEPVRFEHYNSQLDKYFDVVAYAPRFKQFAVIISDSTVRKKSGTGNPLFKLS